MTNSTSIIVRIKKTEGVVWFSGKPPPCDPSDLEFETQGQQRFYFCHIIICTLFVGLLRGLLVCLVWLSFGPIFVGCWLVWFLGLRDSAETRDVIWMVGSTCAGPARHIGCSGTHTDTWIGCPGGTRGDSRIVGPTHTGLRLDGGGAHTDTLAVVGPAWTCGW